MYRPSFGPPPGPAAARGAVPGNDLIAGRSLARAAAARIHPGGAIPLCAGVGRTLEAVPAPGEADTLPEAGQLRLPAALGPSGHGPVPGVQADRPTTDDPQDFPDRQGLSATLETRPCDVNPSAIYKSVVLDALQLTFDAHVHNCCIALVHLHD